MHDPYSLVYEWPKFGTWPYRHLRWLRLTVWHRDRGGHDGACGWFWPDLDAKERARAHSLATNEVDNLQHWWPKEDVYEVENKIARLFVLHKQLVRPWWRHPRWHVHHWRIQIDPFLSLRRKLTRRCNTCRKSFGWYEAPMQAGNGYEHISCYKMRSMPTVNERAV